MGGWVGGGSGGGDGDGGGGCCCCRVKDEPKRAAVYVQRILHHIEVILSDFQSQQSIRNIETLREKQTLPLSSPFLKLLQERQHHGGGGGGGTNKNFLKMN